MKAAGKPLRRHSQQPGSISRNTGLPPLQAATPASRRQRPGPNHSPWPGGGSRALPGPAVHWLLHLLRPSVGWLLCRTLCRPGVWEMSGSRCGRGWMAPRGARQCNEEPQRARGLAQLGLKEGFLEGGPLEAECPVDGVEVAPYRSQSGRDSRLSSAPHCPSPGAPAGSPSPALGPVFFPRAAPVPSLLSPQLQERTSFLHPLPLRQAPRL